MHMQKIISLFFFLSALWSLQGIRSQFMSSGSPLLLTFTDLFVLLRLWFRIIRVSILKFTIHFSESLIPKLLRFFVRFFVLSCSNLRWRTTILRNTLITQQTLQIHSIFFQTKHLLSFLFNLHWKGARTANRGYAQCAYRWSRRIKWFSSMEPSMCLRRRVRSTTSGSDATI